MQEHARGSRINATVYSHKKFAAGVVNIMVVLFVHARYLPKRKKIAEKQLEDKDKKDFAKFYDEVTTVLKQKKVYTAEKSKTLAKPEVCVTMSRCNDSFMINLYVVFTYLDLKVYFE